MAIVKRKTQSTTRPAYPAGAPTAPPPVAGARAAVRPSAADPEQAELERRVAELKDRYAKLQWDLGGLTYEMAARNFFKLEVLRTRAAELQRVDAELGEATRLSNIERAEAGGDCPQCGSLFGRGSFFCWNCGFRFSAPAGRTAPPES
ncbi:MAG: hypothetical protein WAO61_03965 [Solirubrobacterales bacterium]